MMMMMMMLRVCLGNKSVNVVGMLVCVIYVGRHTPSVVIQRCIFYQYQLIWVRYWCSM